MLLDKIKSPQDLAALPLEQLPFVAHEIREEIIRVCSLNGGHLSASLGAVDIAVAVHYVFPEESTRIIWDTGHQAYAHKLLTGRKDRFSTLRCEDGLSGFLKREESARDHFGAGHACTSISAAMGFSRGAALRGEDRQTVALLGDGAATGGMVYEGINNALGHAGRLLVVLNDNEMSISRNVGSISRILTKLTSTRTFLTIEGGTWKALGLIPYFGRKLRALASRAKYGLKHMVLPSNFFEDFGFKYYGPLDGHDLMNLVRTLKQLKQVQGPVILHVLTKKGKGYTFAESNPAKYHGFAPFNKETGNKKSSSEGTPATYTQVFSDTLLELAADHTDLLAITAAMPEGTGLLEFAEKYPDRFFDVGIAEPHAVTFAAGLAADGMRPVVAVYSTFLQRGFDQIVHDVALQKLPVIFALDRAGLVGEDGPTHHGVLDLGFLGMAPGMVIMAPSDENELRQMLATAVQYREGPVALRYPRGQALGLKEKAPLVSLEIGRSRLAREGSGIVILALGSMLHPALAAAESLASQGHDPKVFDARFAMPLDRELLTRELPQADLLVTVEENNPVGSFGERVARFCRQELRSTTPLLTLSLPEGFTPQGRRTDLLRQCGLDGPGISTSILEMVARERILTGEESSGLLP